MNIFPIFFNQYFFLQLQYVNILQSIVYTVLFRVIYSYFQFNNLYSIRTTPQIFRQKVNLQISVLSSLSCYFLLGFHFIIKRLKTYFLKLILRQYFSNQFVKMTTTLYQNTKTIIKMIKNHFFIYLIFFCLTLLFQMMSFHLPHLCLRKLHTTHQQVR